MRKTGQGCNRARVSTPKRLEQGRKWGAVQEVWLHMDYQPLSIGCEGEFGRGQVIRGKGNAKQNRKEMHTAKEGTLVMVYMHNLKPLLNLRGHIIFSIIAYSGISSHQGDQGIHDKKDEVTFPEYMPPPFLRKFSEASVVKHVIWLLWINTR